MNETSGKRTQTEAAGKAPNLRKAVCCGSCTHRQGWEDNMFCGKYDFDTKPALVCDGYESEKPRP